MLSLTRKRKLGYTALGALLGYFLIGGSKKVVDMSVRLCYIGIGIILGAAGALFHLNAVLGG